MKETIQNTIRHIIQRVHSEQKPLFDGDTDHIRDFLYHQEGCMLIAPLELVGFDLDMAGGLWGAIGPLVGTGKPIMKCTECEGEGIVEFEISG